ncbi:MAG: hypothetical protein PF436_10075 [Prolixibacteraceae bacterium]|jgi:hypothetical protein|nr:hypothetical protein [Prolixibacteraceae bacterium]
MDYSEKTNNDSLVYAQWEAIHNPAIIGKVFQSDEDGAMVREPDYIAASRIIRTFRCAINNSENTVYQFIGRRSFSFKVKDLIDEFRWENYGYENIQNQIFSVWLGENSSPNLNEYYYEDIYDVSSRTFYLGTSNSDNPTLTISGQEYTLTISGQDNFSRFKNEELQFLKDLFDVSISISEPDYENLVADDLRKFSDCEFNNLSLDKKKELLTEIASNTNIKSSYQVSAIRLVKTCKPSEELEILNHINGSILCRLYEKDNLYRDDFVILVYQLWSKHSNEFGEISTLSRITSQFPNDFNIEYNQTPENKYEWVLTPDYSRLDNSSRKVIIAETEPLAKMHVKFDGSFISGLDGNVIDAPAIFVRYLMDTDLEATAKRASVHQLNAALLLVGVGEIGIAIQGIVRSGSSVYSILRLASGILDLGTIALGDFCIDENNNFCKAWQKYEILINAGVLSISAVGELALVRKQLLDNYPATRKTLSQSKKNSLDELFEISTLTARYDNLSLELKDIIDNFGFGSLKLADNGSDIIFLAANGTDEVGRIIDDLLQVKYTGYGSDVVCDASKTTTCIGRWPGGTEIIWEYGLAKQGANPAGVNVLGDVDLSLPPPQVWAGQNKTWLDAAIARDDVMRAVSDPLNIDNVFYDATNIPTNVFSSPQSLSNYLTSLSETSVEVSQLGYYGREIRHLFQNSYSFDTALKVFSK